MVISHETDAAADRKLSIAVQTLAAEAEIEPTHGFQDEEVAIAAYYIWEKEGCPVDQDKEHWFLAIEKLRAQAFSVPTVPPATSISDPPPRVLTFWQQVDEFFRGRGQGNDEAQTMTGAASKAPESSRITDRKINTVLARIADFPVQLVDSLFGYDFFLSYRQDATEAYAAALQEQLRSGPPKFSVFRDIDPEGFVAGEALDKETERAIRSATALLALVDRTAFAKDSVYMPEEVLRFQRMGRLIVPVDLEGCLRAARHDEDVRHSLPQSDLTHAMLSVLLDRINVEETSFAIGLPSDTVIAKLRGSLNSVTRSLRRIRALVILALLLLGLAGATGILAVVTLKQNDSLRASLRTNYMRLGDNNWQQGVTARDFKQSPLEAAHYFERSKGYYVRAENTRAAQVSLLAAEALRGCPLTAAIALTGEVRQARYLKDNLRVLTYGREPRVRLWDIGQEAELAGFDTGEIVVGARLDSTEEKLLTWGVSPTAKLWGVTGCQLLREFPHAAVVRGATFNAEGTEILSWSDDGTAKLWETSNAQPLAIFTHAKAVDGALFTRGGDVVTWSTDATAKLWKIGTKTPTAVFQHGGPVFGAGLIDDGRRLITVGQAQAARLWDLTKPKLIAEFRHAEGEVRGAAWDKSEVRLLTWGTVLSDGKVRMWDLKTNKLIATFPPGDDRSEINGARFTKDGKQLLTWGLDGQIKLWQVDNQEVVATFTHKRPVHGAMLDKAETLLLTWGLDDAAKLWDFRTRRPVAVFTHGREMAGAVFDASESKVLTWSDDGTVRQWDITQRPSGSPQFSFDQLIVRAGLNDTQTRLQTISEDGTVTVREFESGREIARFPHGAPVISSWFDSTETTHLTYGSDGKLKVWDVEHSNEIAEVHIGSRILWAQTLVGRSRLITRAPNANSVEVWDLSTRKAVGALNHDQRVIGETPSTDGLRLLTWSADKTAKLWDLASCELLATYTHDDWVQGGAFTWDGQRILTWGNDKAVKFWDLASGKLLDEFRTKFLVLRVDLSRDRRRMLVAGASLQVDVWDIPGHTQIASYTDDQGINGRFDHDERRVLTWSPSGQVKLWRLGQSDPIATYNHGGHLYGAMFAPSEDWILSYSGDRIMKIWDLNRKDSVAEFSTVDLFFTTFNRDGTKLLGCGRRGMTELATLTPGGQQLSVNGFSDEDLAIALEIRSGTRLDSSGVVVALTPSEWHERKNILAEISRKK